MNIDLIPCEICGQSFSLDTYPIHITNCVPCTNARDTNQSTFFQIPTNLELNTNHNASNYATSGSADTIPCEHCSQQIPIHEYESHLVMHSLSANSHSNNAPMNDIPPSITSNVSMASTIPCSHPNCNEQIPFEQYEAHQLLHLDEANVATVSPMASPIMVECQFANCSTKWIPQNEYADHLTLHELQSQQTPNTANDELIAFNHQTQILQQQTANLTLPNRRQIPDPRRICTSPSFDHLTGTQKPVIPIHDKMSLIAPRSLAAPTASDIPSADNHFVSGLIEEIERVLSGRKHLEYYLCDPLLFFYRGQEDYSWGCGFRNMQTLSSSLILKRDSRGKHAAYYRSLFNGIGYVPIIEQIQRYLDYAHGQGFDPEGMKELGLTAGRRVWIGAVDVAAVLRSFYISAAIFDFQLTADQHTHHDMFDWVWSYFQQRYRHHGIQRGNVSDINPSATSSTVHRQPLISSFFGSASGSVSPSSHSDGGSHLDRLNEEQSEDVMLQKALALSKRDNAKNGKMEMDDSDSGSSFSDDEERSKMTIEVEANEEEKKEDENEDDYYSWTKDGGHGGDAMKSKQRMESMHSPKAMPPKKKRIGYRDKGNDYNKRFIPPLYFQHHGHSRTIIGIIHNKKSGLRHLLVLDPSVKKGGPNLLNNIRNGNIQSLLRSKKQISATKYQLVAIPAYGLMSTRDRDACKTIQSMDVTLVNRLTSGAQSND